jgi:sodium-type flagellar protein MotY
MVRAGKHRLVKIGIWLITAGLPLWLQAATYSNFIENGAWSAESSVFACKLVHSIPYFGRAEFSKPAGELAQFRLISHQPKLKAGQAQLSTAPPVWKTSGRKRDLGWVPVQQAAEQIHLQGAKTEQLLADLLDGQEISLQRKPWYGDAASSRVAITPIGFRAAYREYHQCLAKLLPVNFEQIKRTSLYFGSDQSGLTPSERAKLDNIITYLKADPIVKEFFIDGHTDAVGSKPDNLALAQKRAEAVTQYLIKGGLPKDAMWVRWHGERYPVASNENRLGRAKNRRVTIRLETEKMPEPAAAPAPAQTPAPAQIPPAAAPDTPAGTPPAPQQAAPAAQESAPAQASLANPSRPPVPED